MGCQLMLWLANWKAWRSEGYPPSTHPTYPWWEVLLIDTLARQVEGTARRGVPHFSLPHILLLGGAAMLEDLFPGFKQECWDAGAKSFDVIQGYHYVSPPT
jgi:hypothetical protein